MAKYLVSTEQSYSYPPKYKCKVVLVGSEDDVLIEKESYHENTAVLKALKDLLPIEVINREQLTVEVHHG